MSMDVEVPNTSMINYCAIFGSLPGKNVKAKSDLAVEFHQLMVNGSLNIRQEVIVPDHFAKFKGSNNKSTVQNETQSYSIGFGQMSESDKHNLEIFKEYGARLAGEKHNGNEPRTFFEMMQDFNKIVQTFDIKFIWDKVIAQNTST